MKIRENIYLDVTSLKILVNWIKWTRYRFFISIEHLYSMWIHFTKFLKVIYLLGLLLRLAGELEASQLWNRSDVTLLRLLLLRRFSSWCIFFNGDFAWTTAIPWNLCRSSRLAFSRNQASAASGCASRYLFRKIVINVYR